MPVQWSDGEQQALADCPVCGKDRHFRINCETGQSKCLVCGVGWNAYGLIRLWDQGCEQTSLDSYSPLCDSRGISPETLWSWGVVKSVLDDGEWLIPGYDGNGHISNLYKYSVGGTPIPTPTLSHQLHHAASSFNPNAPIFYVCEGPWDGMALWEMLGYARKEKDHRGEVKLVETVSVDRCLRASCEVVAVPGVNVWKEGWTPLFAGKDVCIMYDSDHPVNGSTPAGLGGVELVCRSIAAALPKSVTYLRWGVDGYAPSLPSGFDVTDALMGEGWLVK